MAGEVGMPSWFTVHAHSQEKAGPDGLVPSFGPVADRFDLILQLQSERADVQIRILKGQRPVASRAPLSLDPSTMLIRDRS